MDKTSRIYVAGHRGLVGSAIVRRLRATGFDNLVLRTHAELDLMDEQSTRRFIAEAQPEYVFVAAAKVGGILANNSYPADFIRDNLVLQSNIIHSAYLAGVDRLMFLGSSCIYPKLAAQPIRESSLLTGALEPTNRAYALAKIAGIELCWSYNRQHGTRYIAAMPTNLYGPGDNYHPEKSHVIPALIRKFHVAKHCGSSFVSVWGTGTPRREFMYSDDMASACIHLMNLPDDKYAGLLGSDEMISGRFEPPLINIGVGEDLTIAELAGLIGRAVGYEGRIEFDSSKPDGTPRKLLDVRMLRRTGFQAETSLAAGLKLAYQDFVARAA